jgi:hypothetical protein
MLPTAGPPRKVMLPSAMVSWYSAVRRPVLYQFVEKGFQNVVLSEAKNPTAF